MKVATVTGGFLIRLVRYIGEVTILFGKTVYLCFVPPYQLKRILIQMKRVGPGSFFIAALVAFFVGMILSVQMAHQMVQLSAEIYIPNVVALSLVRELSPVLTALIVAGRVGAGITAELGSMTVTEQVQALEAFAVNPVKYLVVPRFLALILMLPLLTVFADLIGIMGGYVICVFKLHISPALYLTNVAQALTLKDLLTGLLKTLFFGATIALIGCFEGLNTKGGAEGVGQSTTVSVVVSFILIIMINAFFTTMFYFIFNT